MRQLEYSPIVGALKAETQKALGDMPIEYHLLILINQLKMPQKKALLNEGESMIEPMQVIGPPEELTLNHGRLGYPNYVYLNAWTVPLRITKLSLSVKPKTLCISAPSACSCKIHEQIAGFVASLKTMVEQFLFQKN